MAFIPKELLELTKDDQAVLNKLEGYIDKYLKTHFTEGSITVLIRPDSSYDGESENGDVYGDYCNLKQITLRTLLDNYSSKGWRVMPCEGGIFLRDERDKTELCNDKARTITPRLINVLSTLKNDINLKLPSILLMLLKTVA